MVPGQQSPVCPLHPNCCPPAADFLALAVGQKWDRLRLTCSQPFSKHSRFGLSFIRVRTPLDPEHPQPPPPSQQGLVGASYPSVCSSLWESARR